MITYSGGCSCIMCEKKLYSERMFEGKLIKQFTPDHKEVRILLSNRSVTSVPICEECLVTAKEQDLREKVEGK